MAEETIAPLVDRSALLQALSIPFFLYLVFVAKGYEAMLDEAVISSAAGLALLYAVPAFLILNAVRSAFKVRSEEKKLGQWFGTTFVFNEPQLVFMARVTDADNGTVKKFKVEEVEKFGSVEFQIKFEGLEKRRVKAHIASTDYDFSPSPLDIITNAHTYVLTWASKDKTFNLRTECETCNSTIVKIYLVAWHVA